MRFDILIIRAPKHIYAFAMLEKFEKQISAPLVLPFEAQTDGVYAITVKASCKPGWKNKWWLKISSILEDIFNLHLGDEDLRLEIDNLNFPFNSPSSFSGTKMLGRTKTIIFVLHLKKGKHEIKFIPERFAYLKSLEVETLTSPERIAFYWNIQAEEENYYSWLTITSIDQPFTEVTIGASAGIVSTGNDDDDLKIVIDGQTQKKETNRHQHSYFCGFNLKGKAGIFRKEVKFGKGIHFLELFSDRKPALKEIKLIFEHHPLVPDSPILKDKFNPVYLIKDSAFINDESLTEEEIEEFLKLHGEKYPNHLYYRIFDGKKASFLIKKYAVEFGVNPKVILCKLQIEGHLVMGDESINPTQDQYDWALGVGKTDKETLVEYKGFLQQIKSGYISFRNWFYEVEGPPFVVDGVDDGEIRVLNRATAAFYHYTSHIEGADLFYRVYSQLFGTDDLGGTT